MCGIFAVVEPAADAGDPLRIIDRLEHRGPDDDGIFTQASGSLRVGLVHTRLSIIDLSERGHQPMVSDDGTVIVFNGEIYNFRDLRKDLESRGHVFHSNTDTEVLLNAYREWGEACLDRLAGMWAFVIWDPRRQVLFGSRDRFGIKPLYYYLGRDGLILASEIKALLASNRIRRSVHLRRVLEYILLDLHDHTDETFFETVRQVLPAHAFRYEVPTAKFQMYRYWTPARQAAPEKWPQAVDELKMRLERSVREHLVADVPVGFCLSGGIDSSAIVGMARALKSDAAPLLAFTSAYENSPLDERSYAEEVVQSRNVDWHIVFPDPDRLVSDLERMIYFQDEPPPYASVYSQWCVMRLAQENGIKVMLDGQGADELFAGYPAYRDVLAADLLLSGKWGDLRRIGTWSRAAYALLPPGVKAGLFTLRSAAWRSLRPEVREEFGADRLTHWFGQFQYRDLPRRLLKDTFEFNLPKLLHYEDRNSMAFSIESRVPFLDHRVAELAHSLPPEWRLSVQGSKWILREAVRPYLPARIANRKDKIGFVAPESEWLRRILPGHPDLLFSGWAADTLTDRSSIERLIRSGGRSDYNVIWKLICLNVWHRIFFERP